MFQININTKSIIILYNHFTTAVSRAIAFVVKIKNHTQDTHYQGILYNIAREKRNKKQKYNVRQYRAYLIRQHSFHSYFSCDSQYNKSKFKRLELVTC